MRSGLGAGGVHPPALVYAVVAAWPVGRFSVCRSTSAATAASRASQSSTAFDIRAQSRSARSASSMSLGKLLLFTPPHLRNRRPPAPAPASIPPPSRPGR